MKWTKKKYRPTEYWDIEGMLGKVDGYSEKFLPNLDGTNDVDGGDTSFLMGSYYLALNMMSKARPLYLFSSMTHQEDNFKRLRHSFTVYRRHPDPAKWYSDRYRFSRDQQKTVIAAESYNPASWRRVLPFMLRHAMRLFLFDAKLKDNGNDNWKFPTLTGPTIWASYVRYLINMWGSVFYLLYPLLIIFDIELLVNLWIKSTIDKDDNDVLNHIAYSVWFHQVAPTPWTYLNLKLMDTANFLDRLNKYFDDGRNPYFVAEMWETILLKDKTCQ